MEPVDRRLDWPGCRNVRDVGGLPTVDGRVVRAGALIRADSLQYLTPEGVEVVRSAGVSRIIDLRADAELAEAPTPFSGDPLARQIAVQEPADPQGRTTIVDTCTDMLDQHPQRFAAAFRAFIEAPEGAVVVHCHGGKDRTGIVVALALSIAGVPRDEIVADYGLSKANFASLLAEQLAAEPDESLHPEMIEFRDTRAESLVAILRHLDTQYGGPEAYLLKTGLTQDDLSAIRARLLQ
jgi:protein tyrosine/serine phosphatase